MSALARVVGSAGVAALLAVGLPAAPAQAAGELELSLDGVSWSTTLAADLFAGAGLIVPGDVLESDLWVRNASGDRARVELDVADAIGAAPGTLAGDLSLRIDGAPTAGGARWRGPDLAPGSALRIPLVLTFDAGSATTSQVDVATVLDAVILVQTASGPGSAPTTPGPGPTPRAPVATSSGGGLAHTGVEVGGAAGVSFAVIGLGLLLVAARHRSRRARD
ncbi:hypothetical protein HP550_12100 [Cellulomonas humilata]|uniref:Gram-positive cocci surface proteins LPxTG domain-containing protein n=1 Tax=Cellulomonas humilata TaxID=144055 RepID=A0A7Y6DYF2_9CELL|nr:hypothetical protein [Cellulomonas humilata]NUU17992.1 hypothetical protein [Cellulomonas humilata]